jgi:hypothetical protein
MNVITHISVRQEIAMIETLTQIQYIRTTKPLEFEDHRGRTTNLIEGLPGFILDESQIDDLFEITEKERAKCYKLLEFAKERSQTLALVQGYPCILADGDFVKIDKPKSYPVAGEII